MKTVLYITNFEDIDTENWAEKVDASKKEYKLTIDECEKKLKTKNEEILKLKEELVEAKLMILDERVKQKNGSDVEAANIIFLGLFKIQPKHKTRYLLGVIGVILCILIGIFSCVYFMSTKWEKCAVEFYGESTKDLKGCLTYSQIEKAPKQTFSMPDTDKNPLPVWKTSQGWISDSWGVKIYPGVEVKLYGGFRYDYKKSCVFRYSTCDLNKPFNNAELIWLPESCEKSGVLLPPPVAGDVCSIKVSKCK